MVGTRSAVFESDNVPVRYRVSNPRDSKERGRCGKDGEEEHGESEEPVEHAGGLCGSKEGGSWYEVELRGETRERAGCSIPD